MSLFQIALAVNGTSTNVEKMDLTTVSSNRKIEAIYHKPNYGR